MLGLTLVRKWCAQVKKLEATYALCRQSQQGCAKSDSGQCFSVRISSAWNYHELALSDM